MKQIKLEVLAPELCHYYGDRGNLLYLQKKAELMGNEIVINETTRSDSPLFVRGECDALYIAPTTERELFYLIDYLNSLKEPLSDYIESGGMCLIFGNSIESLYESVMKADGETVPALGLFPLHAEQFTGKRYSVNVVAEYDDLTIVGYKNLLSQTREAVYEHPLFRVIREAGRNVTSERYEGVHYKNLFATYLLGGVLLQNPEFSNSLLQKLFGEDYRECYIPFEQEAHAKRVRDVLNSNHPDKNG